MLRIVTPLGLALAALVVARPETSASSSAVTALAAAPTVAAPVHCQVPCGIYGDKLRIDLLMEDIATIEKAMRQIDELSAATPVNFNQVVRWVTTKDEHAQRIQDQVAAYWLSQRIKLPTQLTDAAGLARYQRQLTALHSMIVTAMKCKQSTRLEEPAVLQALVGEFVPLYFTAEDLKHLQESHGFGHKEHTEDADHDHGGR